MNFLRRLIRGELGLGRTYWIFYVVPIALLRVGSTVITNPFTFVGEPNLENAAIWSYNLLLAVVVVGCGIAVVRSAYDKLPVGFWGWAAQIVVVINVVVFFMTMDLNLFSKEKSYTYRLTTEITEMKKYLPKRIDAVTILTDVDFQNGVVTNHYKLEAEAPIRTDLIKEILKKTACSSYKEGLDSKVISAINYRYTSKVQTISITLTSADCT